MLSIIIGKKAEQILGYCFWSSGTLVCIKLDSKIVFFKAYLETILKTIVRTTDLKKAVGRMFVDLKSLL